MLAAITTEVDHVILLTYNSCKSYSVTELQRSVKQLNQNTRLAHNQPTRSDWCYGCYAWSCDVVRPDQPFERCVG